MNPTYVICADQDEVRIKCSQSSIVDSLIETGFERDGGDEFRISVSTDDEKIALFRQMQKLGIAFVESGSWSPAELFQFFIEQGKLNYPFKTINWTGKDIWCIRECDGNGVGRILQSSNET